MYENIYCLCKRRIYKEIIWTLLSLFFNCVGTLSDWTSEITFYIQWTRMFILTSSPSSRVPTPVAVLISAAVFALAHLTPGEFPQLFVLGIMLISCKFSWNSDFTRPFLHVTWNTILLSWPYLKLIIMSPCRNCSGIFLCSNSQPLDPHHHTCFVELWRHFASYLPFGTTLISKWKLNLMFQIQTTKCTELTITSLFFFAYSSKVTISRNCCRQDDGIWGFFC